MHSSNGEDANRQCNPIVTYCCSSIGTGCWDEVNCCVFSRTPAGLHCQRSWVAVKHKTSLTIHARLQGGTYVKICVLFVKQCDKHMGWTSITQRTFFKHVSACVEIVPTPHGSISPHLEPPKSHVGQHTICV